MSTNKQHTLSRVRILFGFFSFVGIRSLPMHSNGREPMHSNGREPMSASGLSLAHHGSHVGLPLALSEGSHWQYRSKFKVCRRRSKRNLDNFHTTSYVNKKLVRISTLLPQNLTRGGRRYDCPPPSHRAVPFQRCREQSGQCLEQWG